MYGNGRDDNDYGRYPRVGISEDRCVYGRRDDCDAVALTVTPPLPGPRFLAFPGCVF